MSPAPMPVDGTSLNPPYTLTSDIGNLNSIGSIFQSVTNMPDSPPTSLSPEQMSSMSAMQASFMSAASQGAKTATSGGQTAVSTPLSTLSTSTTSLQNTAAGAASSSNSAAQSSSASITPSSNTATSASNSIASSHTSASGTSLATSAANTSPNVNQSAGSMSSPGMQAAVAVPVVVVVLAAAALIFFCMRRRRKRGDLPHEEVEKVPIAGAKKPNWTRHLRVFSFDNELLMGGRYSSTNSLRSRQTPSLSSANRNNGGADSPSVHSVEEVAPPYRDAIRSTQPPNIAAIMAGGAVGTAAATTLNRSASGATAPPSYKSPLSRTMTHGSAASSIRDPFADSQSPISPVDGSPFNDPEGLTPPISRTTSIYTNERDDASSVGDAASIRQAQVARNASIMTGGRIVETARRSS